MSIPISIQVDTYTMNHSPTILVVDDEKEACSGLAVLLQDEGYRILTAYNGKSGIDLAREHAPEMALVDQKMPVMDGLEFLKEARQSLPEMGVVMMTAYGRVESAVEALKLGAADYLVKPINFEELLLIIRRVLSVQNLQAENIELREALEERYSFENMVGNSSVIQALFKRVTQVANTDATILLVGETGTGKELVANAIHHCSKRKSQSMVVVNCAALSEGILESELFGHERGAFTGADRKREGRFQRAHRGTLFLDEVTEVSEKIQVKLLRFLESGEVERVGGDSTFHVDVRLIAATNRDPEEMLAAGKIRDDFYYRLRVVELNIPPLRDRKTDIPALVTHFFRQFTKKYDKEVKGLEDDALDILVEYDWPGNVRQLRNVIEQAVVFGGGAMIRRHDLAGVIRLERKSLGAPSPQTGKNLILVEIEREAILEALNRTGGDRHRAADILQISERTLYRKLKEYKSQAPIPREQDED